VQGAPQERILAARLGVFGGEVRIDDNPGERVSAAEQPSEHYERWLSQVRKRKAGGREDSLPMVLAMTRAIAPRYPKSLRLGRPCLSPEAAPSSEKDTRIVLTSGAFGTPGNIA